MAIKQLLLEEVIPGVGVIVATFLFGSPLLATIRVRRTQELGALNILPFLMMALNCVAWTGYACVTTDIYVFVANVIGLMLGFFYLLSTFHLAPQKVRDQIAVIFHVAIFVKFVLSYLCTTQTLTGSGPKIAWGITANIILVFFYTSPLSTMLHVVRTRNSASILPPLSLLSAINGALWVAYGLAISAPFLYVPNALGVVTGGVQLLLCALYPRKPPDSPTPSQTQEQGKIEPEAYPAHVSLEVPLSFTGKKVALAPADVAGGPRRADSEVRSTILANGDSGRSAQELLGGREPPQDRVPGTDTSRDD